MVIEYSSVPITFKQTIYHVITLMCVCWEWSHAVEIIDCMIDRHTLLAKNILKGGQNTLP